ncbi:hypothetical protein ME9_01258 [Bartonella taylorii 8TBB]|uniref:Uncharacterized protein n=1 Tax=Bartonella taylorii 8TBB TaxID=1094560 RepID=A0A9P2RZF6_BARTA|nr:hypothetical protein ME9_01258 [Bartonella taylorii 8TBB]OPB35547.1 hypothetical protein Btaycd_003930 [Bartonella taylorii]
MGYTTDYVFVNNFMVKQMCCFIIPLSIFAKRDEFASALFDAQDVKLIQCLVSVNLLLLTDMLS